MKTMYLFLDTKESSELNKVIIAHSRWYQSYHHIICFKVSNSLKVNIDCWNITTLVWLRRVVYDRVPPHVRTLATFMVSAVWHGFYPGYYICFTGAALCTVAARLVS